MVACISKFKALKSNHFGPLNLKVARLQHALKRVIWIISDNILPFPYIHPTKISPNKWGIFTWGALTPPTFREDQHEEDERNHKWDPFQSSLDFVRLGGNLPGSFCWGSGKPWWIMEKLHLNSLAEWQSFIFQLHFILQHSWLYKWKKMLLQRPSFCFTIQLREPWFFLRFNSWQQEDSELIEAYKRYTLQKRGGNCIHTPPKTHMDTENDGFRMVRFFCAIAPPPKDVHRGLALWQRSMLVRRWFGKCISC